MKPGFRETNIECEDRLASMRNGVRLMRNPYLIASILFLIIAASACNPQFDAYTNSGRYYSIFGFLNARADTQYIRIEELRDSMPRSTPVNLHVIVKLADITSSQSVIMRDSLVHFADGPVHNFYTTEKIIPSHTYKLTVTGPAGQESGATITMPPMFPKPEITKPVNLSNNSACYSESNIYANIRIRGVPKLVAVNAIYKTDFEIPSLKGPPKHMTNYWLFKELKDTLHQADGSILGRVNYYRDLCSTNLYSANNATVKKIIVVIAAGNRDWPNLVGQDNQTAEIPTLNTNIQNGVGFLGGIITDTLTIYGN